MVHAECVFSCLRSPLSPCNGMHASVYNFMRNAIIIIIIKEGWFFLFLFLFFMECSQNACKSNRNIPLTGGSEEGRTHDAASSRTASLTHNRLSYSGRPMARMHHKVVGHFGSEADVQSPYYRHFRFNDTSDVGACTHGRPAK